MEVIRNRVSKLSQSLDILIRQYATRPPDDVRIEVDVLEKLAGDVRADITAAIGRLPPENASDRRKFYGLEESIRSIDADLAQIRQDVTKRAQVEDTVELGASTDAVRRTRRDFQERNQFSYAHKTLDETLTLASTTLETLTMQSELLRGIHAKVLHLTGNIKLGDRTVAQIMHIDNITVFVAVIGVFSFFAIFLIIRFLI